MSKEFVEAAKLLSQIVVTHDVLSFFDGYPDGLKEEVVGEIRKSLRTVLDYVEQQEPTLEEFIVASKRYADALDGWCAPMYMEDSSVNYDVEYIEKHYDHDRKIIRKYKFEGRDDYYSYWPPHEEGKVE